jgi:hypothetical protein
MKGSPFSLSTSEITPPLCGQEGKTCLCIVVALLSLLLLLLLQRGNQFEGEYEDLMFVSNPMMNMMLQGGLGLHPLYLPYIFRN